MTEAEEPAPRRPTGVGWPDATPPAAPEPPPQPAPEPSPPPARPVSDIRYRRPDTTVELPRQAGTSPARSPYPQPPGRPGTVTAAAVILFVSAGIGLLACCGLNVLAGEATLGDDEQNLLMLFSAIIVVFSLLNIVLGYYILQAKQWARVATIVVCVIGIITGLISVFAGLDGAGGSNSLGSCLGLVLNIVIIGLLSGSSASEYFRYARG
jgi:hypothetical protein